MTAGQGRDDRRWAVSSRVRIGWQDLDSDLALQARIVRGVDDPHPAVAELGADRVRAELRAGGERHGSERAIIAVAGRVVGSGRIPEDLEHRFRELEHRFRGC